MLRFVVLASLIVAAFAGGQSFMRIGSSSESMGPSMGSFGSMGSMGSYGSSLGSFGSSLGSMGSSLGSFGSSLGSMGSSMGSFGSMGSLNSMGSLGSFGGLSGYRSQGGGYSSLKSGYGGAGLSSFGSMGLGSMGSFNKLSSGGYGSASGYSGGLIPAAVQSRRSVQFYDVPSSYEAAAPLTNAVAPNSQPINFLMNTQSSPLNLETSHQGSAGSFQETQSQDEPHVRMHTVTRPVMQELREIITPFRKIKQEIQPVQEEINTLVSRGQQGYANQGYGTQSLGLNKLSFGKMGSTSFSSGGYGGAPQGLSGSGFSTFSMGAPAKLSGGGY